MACCLNFRKNINLIINCSFLTTMYEMDIEIHTVVTPHGAGKVTYHEKLLGNSVNNIFLPEIRTLGPKYCHTL